MPPAPADVVAEGHVELLKKWTPPKTPESTRRLGSTVRRRRTCICAGREDRFAINVFGGVTTCLTSRKVVGNILEQPFEEIWAALGGKTSIKYPDNHPCATCKFHSICAGCPATVESLTGLPDGYVQQYCQMSHLRAYELGYHPTGVPRTIAEGIPAGVRTPERVTPACCDGHRLTSARVRGGLGSQEESMEVRQQYIKPSVLRLSMSRMWPSATSATASRTRPAGQCLGSADRLRVSERLQHVGS